MLCQNRVWAIGQPGDSGSPVFLKDGDEATVVGIHWGGSSSSSVYSPWMFIHGELGGPTLDLE